MNKRFTRDLLVVSLAKMLLKAKMLLLIPIITKILGEYDYGIYSLISTTIALILPVATLSSEEVYSRFLSNSALSKVEKNQRFLSYSVLVGIITSLTSFLIVISNDFISNLIFGNNTGRTYLLFLIILFSISSFQQNILYYIKSQNHLIKYSLLDALISTTDILAGLSLLFFETNLISFLTILSCLNILSSISVIVLSLKDIKLVRPSFSVIYRDLRFGLPLIPSKLFNWVIRLFDRYILAIFFGPTVVGIYSVAYGVSYFIIQMFNDPLMVAMLPTLAQAQEDRNYVLVSKYISQALRFFLMISIPSMTGIYLLGREILTLISTQAISDQGTIIIPIMTLAAVFYGCSMVLAHYYKLYHRTSREMLLWFLSSITNIFLNILLIPRYGIVGAALATLASSLSLCLLMLLDFGNQLDRKLLATTVSKTAIASFFMFVVTSAVYNFLINSDTLVRLLLTVSTGMLVYAISVLGVRAISQEEVHNFYKIFKSIILFQSLNETS